MNIPTDEELKIGIMLTQTVCASSKEWMEWHDKFNDYVLNSNGSEFVERVDRLKKELKENIHVAI